MIGDLFQQFAAKYLGNRSRHSALEYQPALGPGLGARSSSASLPEPILNTGCWSLQAR